MAIPPSPATGWSELDTAAKRARLLAAAGEVFARDGLDAPMPAIAAAAGAGVGSVYRQFPAKRDLLAALVVERHEAVEAKSRWRWPPPGPLGGAGRAALGHRRAPDRRRRPRRGDGLRSPRTPGCRRRWRDDALARSPLDAAKAEGRLRPDATALDLRLLFAATRAAEKVEPGGWHRLVELGVDALAA